MKKSLIYIFAAAAMLAGCAKEGIKPAEEEIVNIPEGGFVASFEAPATTKAHFKADSYAVLWDEADLIDINGCTYQITELRSGNTLATFVPVDAAAVPNLNNEYVAMYGSTDLTDQVFTPGYVNNLPMECITSGYELVFQNTHAVLEVNIPEGLTGTLEVYEGQAVNAEKLIASATCTTEGVEKIYIALEPTMPKGQTDMQYDHPIYLTIAANGQTLTTKKAVSLAANTIYPIDLGAAVAKIGGEIYMSLESAAAAATSGQTIIFLADIADAGSINLKAGVTIDGDGNKISGESSIAINAAGGTIQNVIFENIHNNSNDLSAIYARNLEGTATITDCTFDNVDWDAIQISPLEGSSISITDNIFKHTDENSSQNRYIHIQAEHTAGVNCENVVVTRNQFYKTKNTSAEHPVWNISMTYVKNFSEATLSGNYFEYESGSDTVSINSLVSDFNYIYYNKYLFPILSSPDAQTADVNLVYFVDSNQYTAWINPENAAAVIVSSVTYNSIADAIAANASKTSLYIKLLRDNYDAFTVPSTMSVTIQLNTGNEKLNGRITNNGKLYLQYGDQEGGTAMITNNHWIRLKSKAASNYTVKGESGEVEIGPGSNSSPTINLSKIEGTITLSFTQGSKLLYFTTDPRLDSRITIPDGFIVKQETDGTWTVCKE